LRQAHQFDTLANRKTPARVNTLSHTTVATLHQF